VERAGTVQSLPLRHEPRSHRLDAARGAGDHADDAEVASDGRGGSARARLHLLLSPRRAAGQRQHRRRPREVARAVRPRERRRVRPLRLDVLLARRLRPVLPGLLRRVAVAQRRDRHDLRDRRRRPSRRALAARGWHAALAPRWHRQALRRGTRHHPDHVVARRGARARLPRLPPARRGRRTVRRHSPRDHRAGARSLCAPRSW
jgi:hypothetical protein